MTIVDKPHLLVVDDDSRLQQLLFKYLTEQDFHVTTASNAREARELLDTFIFDLIILDVMMPGETGIELTKSLQKEGGCPPILMLTAMGDVENRITGLESGADEYLPKPFEPKELLLRIRAILRRVAMTSVFAKNEIQIGSFYFDVDKEKLRRGSEDIFLTNVEANLLKIFALNPGRPISREELIEKSGIITNPRTIDVQVTRLRRKLEEDPRFPQFLQTVRHVGYILWLH
jgi:two-component system phosphate regulon response regulator OmpR